MKTQGISKSRPTCGRRRPSLIGVVFNNSTLRAILIITNIHVNSLTHHFDMAYLMLFTLIINLSAYDVYFVDSLYSVSGKRSKLLLVFFLLKIYYWLISTFSDILKVLNELIWFTILL